MGRGVGFATNTVAGFCSSDTAVGFGEIDGLFFAPLSANANRRAAASSLIGLPVFTRLAACVPVLASPPTSWFSLTGESVSGDLTDLRSSAPLRLVGWRKWLRTVLSGFESRNSSPVARSSNRPRDIMIGAAFNCGDCCLAGDDLDA